MSKPDDSTKRFLIDKDSPLAEEAKKELVNLVTKRLATAESVVVVTVEGGEAEVLGFLGCPIHLMLIQKSHETWIRQMVDGVADAFILSLQKQMEKDEKEGKEGR